MDNSCLDENITLIPSIVVENFYYNNDPRFILNANFSYNDLKIKPTKREVFHKVKFIESDEKITVNRKRRNRKRNKKMMKK